MTREELYQEIAKLGPEMSSGERMAGYFGGQEVDCQPYMMIAEIILASIARFSCKCKGTDKGDKDGHPGQRNVDKGV